MTLKMESPATSGKVNGAECKAAGFTASEYPNKALVATGPIALRIAHLIHRANVDPGAAATLAGLIWEGAA